MIHEEATELLRQKTPHIVVRQMNIHLDPDKKHGLPAFDCEALPEDTRGQEQRTKCFSSWWECVQAVLDGYRPTLLARGEQ